MKATSIAVLFVLLEAITIGVPWRQCVRVALTSEGAAVSGRRFRLVSGDATNTCNSHELEGTSDADGRFEGARWQWSTAVELLDVLVRRDALCLLEPDGTWVRAWDLPYGPPPRVFALTCDLAPSRPATTVPVETKAGSKTCRLASGR